MSFLFTAYRGGYHRDTYYNANGCVTCGCLVEDDWPTQRCPECKGVPVSFEEEGKNYRIAIQQSLDWIQEEDPEEYNKRMAEMMIADPRAYEKRQKWIKKQEARKREHEEWIKKQEERQRKIHEEQVTGQKRKRAEDDPVTKMALLESPEKKQKLD